jgi:hypothetical protein
MPYLHPRQTRSVDIMLPDSTGQRNSGRVVETSPLVRTGSNEHSDAVLVPMQVVKKVLAHFEAGRLAAGLRSLHCLCPEVADLPPFEIV